MIPLSVTLAVLFYGLCVGSFLNVCIYRVPLSRSIVRPGSACPSCGTAIRWYDNIPVVSYLILLGRCRACKARVSIRYPAIEALTGGAALVSLYAFGPSASALVHFLFYSVLITLTFIDIDHRIIPDVISLPGIPLFFLLSLAVPTLSWQDAALGILIGGGSLWLIAWLYERATGKAGMGGGDVKLLGMMGAFIGWEGVLFTVFFSSLTGSVIGLSIMLAQRGTMKMAIPYGPFLAAGGVVYTLFGARLIGWYFGLLG
ncbi:prepilin peptidase [Desulfoluna spongiiphila]|uniref:Prepilin leader peptidase/N-methyltransferase n=1 Tax=Desulfoluna spongiiphila TaxID=419481 RepID=A0A1G5FQ55_9BACT|nr:A24 family peptidase [Desulfoluna spongiiphila]SCY41267.1 type 4 prepilin peptidase 1 Aspartic peptidase. MEROPS family A24A [Desulfoluna spongiiphila]VVS95473.1 peptidase a24a prepilin type iv bacterial [Desulfoluna spongiiphila]